MSKPENLKKSAWYAYQPDTDTYGSEIPQRYVEAQLYTYDFNKDKPFTRFYITEYSKEVIVTATKPELWLFWAIERYLSPYDNALRESGLPNGKLLNIYDLESKLGLKYNNIRRLMTGLRKKNFVKEFALDRQGKAIILNPNLVQCGDSNSFNPLVLKEFDLSITEESNFVKVFRYEKSNLTHGEAWLSVLMRFMVCYDDCILRANGHRNGRIISKKDLPEIVGEGYQNVWKLVSGLKKKGWLKEFPDPDGQEMAIAVSPHYILKGKKIKNSIKNLFEKR